MSTKPSISTSGKISFIFISDNFAKESFTDSNTAIPASFIASVVVISPSFMASPKASNLLAIASSISGNIF